MAIAIDPVCLMEVDTVDPPGGHSEYESTDYYFCSRGCKVAFDRDPEHVLSGEGVVPMDQGDPGDKPRRPSGGILGYFRRLFGMRSEMD
jgi:YHS domain-containing protein